MNKKIMTLVMLCVFLLTSIINVEGATVTLEDSEGSFGMSVTALLPPFSPSVQNISLYNGSFGMQLEVLLATPPPINYPVNFSYEYPLNNSVNNSLGFTWNITMIDDNGDTFNWSIECNNSQSNTGNVESNGSKTLVLSGLSYSTVYTVWVNATDNDTVYTRELFYFTTTSAPVLPPVVSLTDGNGVFGMEVNVVEAPPIPPPLPTVVSLYNGSFGMKVYIEYYVWSDWSDWWEMMWINFAEPSNFIASSFNNNSINLTWTKDTNATHTYIRRNTGSYPTSLTDGEFVANTTLDYYDDTNLAVGTLFYYKAWSYNNSVNLFTDTFSTDDAWTTPGNPLGLIPTNRTMLTISLEWQTGINRTQSVLIINETTYPTTPYEGVEKYNSTGNSTVVTGLMFNTTYYFSVWEYNNNSGLFSDGYAYAINTTIDEPNPPISLQAKTYTDTIINISWVKENTSDGIVVRSSIADYPEITTGTEIFNSSSGTTYQHTGLTPATKYYYTAWGWNGEIFTVTNRTAYNVTFPEEPQNFTGSVVIDNLEMDWDKGYGADYTMIRNHTGGYPTKTSGNLVYNDTGINTTIVGVSTIDYFKAWSWNNTYQLWSVIGTELLWGGIEINVYKESEPQVEITNYTVFITNKEGTETFEETSANNPFRIDVNDVPHGLKTAISISKDGYYTQVQYHDLYTNVWNYLEFYLPPKTEGGGTPGQPDYIPPEDENESYGELYLLTVEDVDNKPIEEAKMLIRRYINTTETYETITIRYTDANGHIDTYLIPGGFYKVTISKTGYVTEYADYIPSTSIYTHTFRLHFDVSPGDLEEELWDGISWRITPTTAYHRTNITITYNISSSYCQLEYFGMSISKYNTTTDTWVIIYTENITDRPCGGQLTYTTPNTTGRYALTAWFKKANFSEFQFDALEDICRYFYITWEQLTQQLEEIPADIYFLIGIVLAIAAMGLLVRFGASDLAGFVGLAILTVTFMLRQDLTIGGVPWYFVILVTGIVYGLIMFVRSRV